MRRPTIAPPSPPRTLSALASTSLLLRSVTLQPAHAEQERLPPSNTLQYSPAYFSDSTMGPHSAWSSDDEGSDLDDCEDESEISLDDETNDIETEFSILFTSPPSSPTLSHHKALEADDLLTRPSSPSKARFHPVITFSTESETTEGPVVRIVESHPSLSMDSTATDESMPLGTPPTVSVTYLPSPEPTPKREARPSMTRSRSAPNHSNKTSTRSSLAKRHIQMPTPPPSPTRERDLEDSAPELICRA